MIKLGDTVSYDGPVSNYMGMVDGTVVALAPEANTVVIKWPGLKQPVKHDESALIVTHQAQDKTVVSNDTNFTDDGVRKPSHYQVFDGVESIEIIARSMTVSEFRGFCLGNVLKYRLRAGKKSELATMEKDLKKAAFYQELFDLHKGKCHDSE
ncbi:nucleotide kinase [Enterobacter phage EV136_1]|uniref:Nucleotide kinase n=1 Tax=Enterobacter phage EV136_1 TaxID=2849096 RepID=A0A8F2F5I2_9CAUD|nr:nucleotide kinase [Enterobacter phage EV136_1]